MARKFSFTRNFEGSDSPLLPALGPSHPVPQTNVTCYENLRSVRIDHLILGRS